MRGIQSSVGLADYGQDLVAGNGMGYGELGFVDDTMHCHSISMYKTETSDILGASFGLFTQRLREIFCFKFTLFCVTLETNC